MSGISSKAKLLDPIEKDESNPVSIGPITVKALTVGAVVATGPSIWRCFRNRCCRNDTGILANSIYI